MCKSKWPGVKLGRQGQLSNASGIPVRFYYRAENEMCIREIDFICDELLNNIFHCNAVQMFVVVFFCMDHREPAQFP